RVRPGHLGAGQPAARVAPGGEGRRRPAGVPVGPAPGHDRPRDRGDRGRAGQSRPRRVPPGVPAPGAHDAGRRLHRGGPMTEPAAPRPGAILWTDLTVPDAERVRDFYEGVVGWTPTAVEMGGYADWSMETDDGTAVAGVCHARG